MTTTTKRKRNKGGEDTSASDVRCAARTTATAGGGDSGFANDSNSAAPAIGRLRTLQAHRVIAMRQALRQRLTALSFIRTEGGWRWDDDEKTRTEQKARAQRILDYLWKSKTIKKDDGDIDLACRVAPLMEVMLQSIEPVESLKGNIEKEMKKAAKTLPVYAWIKDTKGFSEMTLAVIVGECGDLSDYPSWKHVAKRMGLSPFRGRMGSTWKMQSGKKDSLSADEWVTLGYCGRRRAIMHTIGEAQIRNGTPYRVIYDAWKERELAREDENKPKNQMHAHKRALIVMQRQMIRDLYQAWKAAKLEL